MEFLSIISKILIKFYFYLYFTTMYVFCNVKKALLEIIFIQSIFHASQKYGSKGRLFGVVTSARPCNKVGHLF
jgi:hypothetical protein